MTRARNRNTKKPTCVSLVEAELSRIDDFATTKILVTATGLSANQVHASLHHLQKYKAADCVADHDKLWWFLTPATDTRVKKVEERRPEDQPRRSRRAATPKVAP